MENVRPYTQSLLIELNVLDHDTIQGGALKNNCDRIHPNRYVEQLKIQVRRCRESFSKLTAYGFLTSQRSNWNP